MRHMANSIDTTLTSNNSSKSYILILLIIGTLGLVVFKNISLPRELILPIAILGALGLTLVSFLKPEFSLLILAGYAPFSKVIVGQFGSGIVGFNLTNIIMIILIVGWIVKVAMNRQELLSHSSLNWMILAFFTWGILAIVRASATYGAQYPLDSIFILFKRWITPILLFFLSFNIIRDKDNFKKVVFVIMLVTFMIALMAIRDYMNVGNSSSLDSSRVGGVFEQPNMLGAFFVYNMFFFAGFILCYWRSLKYWLLVIPFLACFRGIMVTFSRGAYLSFAFGSLVTAFFKSKVLFTIAIILIVAALFVPGILPEGIQYRLESTFKDGRLISTDVSDIKDSSAGKRILIWQGAIEMIKDQPLFGFGYGLFPYIIGTYSPQTPQADAHNTYLILAAEMGIPALLIFLIILIILIKNAWWLLNHTEDKYFKAFAIGALGGLFGLIVGNMFGSRLNTEEVSSYFWIIAGLIMRAVVMRKNNEIA